MRSIAVYALLLATGALLLAGCATDYRSNRVYLPPPKYQFVQQLYEETQSLDIVRRRLELEQWYRSEINEALYRLRMEYAIPDAPEDSAADDVAKPNPAS